MTAPVTIHGPWTLGTNLTATGNVVDASGGGGGVTGLGTPGYVAIWWSPTNLASSSIYDNNTSVSFTKGTITTPAAVGTSGTAGVSLTIATGNGDGVGSSGSLGITLGTPGTSGYPGTLTIAGGGPGAAHGGGRLYLLGGVGGADAYGGGNLEAHGGAAGVVNAPGGTVIIQGGAVVAGGNGQGGTVSMQAYNGSDTGNGGQVNITSGDGGSTSGNGGNVNIFTGNAVSGNGGNLAILLGVTGGGGTRGRLNVVGLPTSNAGLASGDVWLNSNVLTIIP